MNKLAVLGTVLSLSFSSFAAEPWMSLKWTEQFCEYWNKNMQTVMAEWAEYNVNKQKGYKTIQFYREDCNPPKKVEVRIKYENGKAVCIYGGEAKDPNPEFVMHATDENWKSLAKGEFGFMGMGIMKKMTFQGSKVEAMKFVEPFKTFLMVLEKFLIQMLVHNIFKISRGFKRSREPKFSLIDLLGYRQVSSSHINSLNDMHQFTEIKNYIQFELMVFIKFKNEILRPYNLRTRDKVNL